LIRDRELLLESVEIKFSISSICIENSSIQSFDFITR
jgi:hypothetical protein